MDRLSGIHEEIYYNLSVWYKLTNKTYYGAIVAIIGGLITIILNIIFIPIYGYVGSAWVNFASYFVILVISYFWGRKIYRVNYELNKVLLYTLLAVAIYFVSTFLVGFQTSVYYSFVTLLLIIYVLFVFIIEFRRKKHVNN